MACAATLPGHHPGGRLVGIALPGADGRDTLVAISAPRRELGELVGPAASPAPPARVAVDALYESAMPVTLRVIAER